MPILHWQSWRSYGGVNFAPRRRAFCLWPQIDMSVTQVIAKSKGVPSPLVKRMARLWMCVICEIHYCRHVAAADTNGEPTHQENHSDITYLKDMLLVIMLRASIMMHVGFVRLWGIIAAQSALHTGRVHTSQRWHLVCFRKNPRTYLCYANRFTHYSAHTPTFCTAAQISCQFWSPNTVVGPSPDWIK